MGGSLNQPCRVREEGPTGCKPLFRGKKRPDESGTAGTPGIRIG